DGLRGVLSRTRCRARVAGGIRQLGDRSRDVLVDCARDRVDLIPDRPDCLFEGGRDLAVARREVAGLTAEVDLQQLLVGQCPGRAALPGLPASLVIEMWWHGRPDLDAKKGRVRVDAFLDDECTDRNRPSL